MKIIQKILFPLFLILLLVFANKLYAEWEYIGPSGGWMTCMKSLPDNPQKMFCGTLQGGAYYSNDRAETWQLIAEIGEHNPVYDISVLPDGIIYIASKEGLFFSKDYGNNWSKVLSVPTWQVVALKRDIVAADVKQSDLDVSSNTRPTNLPWAISYNQGVNWQNWEGTVDSSISYQDYIYNREKRGNIIITDNGELYRTNGLKIFKADNDNWNTWSFVNTLNEWMYKYCYAFLFKPVEDSICYAYAESYDFHPIDYFSGGIFKTTDNWQTHQRVKKINSVTSIAIYNNDLFVGATMGIDFNTNSRLIKFDLTTENTLELDAFGGDIIAIDAVQWNNGQLIIATESGIYKTNDAAETWIKSDLGINHFPTVAVQTIQTNDNSERIIVAAQKGGIHASESNENNWQCKDETVYVTPGLLQKSPSNPQYVYSGGNAFYRSFNSGESWYTNPHYNFPAFYYYWYGRMCDISIDPTDETHIIANFNDIGKDVVGGIVYAETFDAGDSWETFHWFSNDHNNSWKTKIDSVKNRKWISNRGSSRYDIDLRKIIYFADPAFLVLDTTSHDSLFTITLPDSDLASFWTIDGDTCYSISHVTNKFYRSNDLGQTWFVTELPCVIYDPFNGYWQDWAIYEPLGQLTLSLDKKNLFFICPGTGVLWSKDKGDTWQTLNKGLSTKDVYQIDFSSINPSIAYLATFDGLYKMDLTTGIDWQEEQNDPNNAPENYLICGVYPNPFNPITTITFKIENPGILSICIYDLLGRSVQQLKNKQAVNPGNYSIQWDARNFVSGIYFVKITVNDKSLLKKITLLK